MFKGGAARVVRSSPQFGFTLLAYEYLHKVGSMIGWENACTNYEVHQLFPVSTQARRCQEFGLRVFLQYPVEGKSREVETALTTISRPEDMSRIRARNALKILLDVHGDFGRRAAATKMPLSLSSGRLDQ
jgi:solute carrier family 25 aspartate/glutamate transporter 12/13